MSTKQVAFTLRAEDHDRLKRLSASMDRTMPRRWPWRCVAWRNPTSRPRGDASTD